MNIRRRLLYRLVTCLVLISLIISGCAEAKDQLSPKRPITITIWHNYFGGGVMQNKMDGLIDEFNRTIGHEQGITVNTTLIGTSSDLIANMDSILKGEPGAPDLPNIAIVYPRTAKALLDHSLILNLDPHFSAEEKSAFIPEFLDEGKINDQLYVLPANKSTEVIFLNTTFFNQLANELHATVDHLTHTEDLFAIAQRYTELTDSQTPERTGDGKSFLAIDSWYNFIRIYMRQQGQEFILADGSLNVSNPHFVRIWNMMADAALRGSLSTYSGYASEISRVGEIVCAIGSTAGILYYGQEVTFPDGQTQPVDYQILPFPVSTDGRRIAIQRGGGLIVTASSSKAEKASIKFLKWFTEAQRNDDFTLYSGYLPVKKAISRTSRAESADGGNSAIMRSLQTTLTEMSANYSLSFTPAVEEDHTVYVRFDQVAKKRLAEARTQAKIPDPDSAEYEPFKQDILNQILLELSQ